MIRVMFMTNTQPSFSPTVTVHFTIHRPETVFLVAKQMRQHDAIFLEEPPDTLFGRMLAGKMTIDEYIKSQDVEYPAFTRRMCVLLRNIKAEGRHIYQIEPFLEALLNIHDFFSQGHRPEEIEKNSVWHSVYHAERRATAALLKYYQVVMEGSFRKTIGAVKLFAQQDAARFRLRDAMRAKALAPIVQRFSSSYIEAGAIHFALLLFLRQKKIHPKNLRVRFLSRDIFRRFGKKGHLYGPGDLLTLRYIFHPEMQDSNQDDLLAARSIIYSKMIQKTEQIDHLDTFPHIRNERLCIHTVNRLSWDDCQRLFPIIRHVKSADACDLVAEYLARHVPRNRTGIKNGDYPHKLLIETF